MTAIEDDLTRVLWAHQFIERGRVYDRCGCRWYGTNHSAHLAAVLAPIVAAHVAAGQEWALLDAADELEGRLGVAGTPKTLWDFRHWLRDRAATYTGTSGDE